MKEINFKSPCHIGDVVYYVWAAKRDNKYAFEMKESIVRGFLIGDFAQYVCVKGGAEIEGVIDVPMNCVSTNKDIVKTVYNRLVAANKKRNTAEIKRSNIFSEDMYAVLCDDNFPENVSVRSEYELGERFVNRHKTQDVVTGILVRNENEIASIMGEDGGVYSFLELKEG